MTLLKTFINNKSGKRYFTNNEPILNTTNSALPSTYMILYRNENYKWFVREENEFKQKFTEL